MWRAFFLRLVAVFLGGSLILTALLALADPWGMLPFRSPLPRVPADRQQRWAYPELARDPAFDAAIIGNSTSRLIDPADLDPAVDARFVNLAVIHTFSYDQMQMLDVFLAAHPAPKALLIGFDRLWCERGDDLERYGYGPPPGWLYDGDRLAALGNLLNIHAIEVAWRSASAVLGFSARPYSANGFQWLDVDRHPYNPALARSLIATNLAEPWLPQANPDPASWHYVALDWLRERLDRLPAATKLLFVFVPRHHLYPAPGTTGAAMMAECKNRVVALARTRHDAAVYDLSIPSPMTLDESRWWDAVHLRPEPMAQLSRELGAAIAGQASEDVGLLYAPVTRSARGPRSASD